MSNGKVEYVLFDMDGLLIDSERVYSEVTNDILAEYGKVMTWDIKAGLMGKPERDAAAHLLSFFPDLPEEFTIDTYLDLRRAGQDARWPHVKPLPGVIKLIRHLHKHKVPMAVATSSMRRNFELKSSHLIDDLFGYFDAAKTCLGREVGEGEEGESHLTDEYRSERAKGLVFEDSIPGMQAAKRAGMRVVWVPDPELLAIGNGDTSNTLEQADLMLNSLEHFKPEEWGLPPYDEV
ncbi:HAD superfamily protein [Abortiporus biennis]